MHQREIQLKILFFDIIHLWFISGLIVIRNSFDVGTYKAGTAVCCIHIGDNCDNNQHFATSTAHDRLKCYTLAVDDSFSAQIGAFAELEEYRKYKEREIELSDKLAANPGNSQIKSDLDDAKLAKEKAITRWEKGLEEAQMQVDRMLKCGL